MGAAVLQRTQRDGIGGAEQAVQPSRFLEQLLRLMVAGFHIELGNAHALGTGDQSRRLEGRVKALAAGKSGGLVQQRDPQIPRRTAAFLEHQRGGGLRRAEIVMIDRMIALAPLAQNHHRHPQALQHRMMLRREDGGNEDDAVHCVVAQKVQRLHLLGVVVGGIH